MAEMTKKERVRAALTGQGVDHAPCSLWGHDFLREWSPEDLVATTMEAYEAGDWDIIKLNPRATYFAEAWGNTYERPTEQRQPRPLSDVVTSAEQLAAVRPADAHGGVFAEHLLALRLLLGEVGASVDVVQTIFSPLSVAAMLGGAPARFIDYAKERPEAAHAAVASVAETLIEYARASVDAGAAGIFFAPLTWASRDTCDDDFYREFGRPYDLQVLAAVSGAELNILHVCRNNNMIDLLLDYPVAAFNWADHGAGNPSLADVRSGTDKAVMGGIDHARLHKMSPEDVTAQARDALSSGAERLFVTGGCAIAPSTPAANRAALAAAVRAN